MSDYLKGTARSQVLMLPECVDDYVGADNPVRVIEAFVAQLDWKALGVDITPEATGRPGYDPRDLLGLYIYGYLHRIRSSRELERQTHHNLEVMWLLRGLRPDHKTLSEFRRQHVTIFKKVLRQFNLLCRELELFGRQLVAIDGAHFKAVNSRGRNHTRASLKRRLQAVEAGIQRYLSQAESLDRDEEGFAVPKAAALQDKLKALTQSKERCEGLLKELEAGAESQVSLTDRESRLMKKTAGSAAVVGYNVQSAVDAKHHLIVEVEATNACNDFGQLSATAVVVKEQLEVEKLDVLADGGYRQGPDLERCEAAGISPYVPAPPDGQQERGLYGREAFVYDAQADVYHCPGGQQLRRRPDEWRRGLRQLVYHHRSACLVCPLRAGCTRGSFRKMQRGEAQQALDNAAARVKQRPEIYAQRKMLVEHPFGTLKFWWAQGAFLLRGRQKVNAELQLSALAYNLRRVLNLLGSAQLLGHLKGKIISSICAWFPSTKKIASFCLCAPTNLFHRQTVAAA